MARANSNGKNNSLKQPKEEINIKYMHRPPRIAPNYGNTNRSLLPKSKVSRVLLYDNATQNHMLHIKLAHINIEKERICRIINLHKRSFSTRMSRRHHMRQALAAGTRHTAQTGSTNDVSKDPSPRSNNGGNGSNFNSPRLLASYTAERPSSFPPHGRLQRNELIHLTDDGRVAGNDATHDGNAKLPIIEHSDKRHVIFKVHSNKKGKTEVFHTVDGSGVLSDIIPVHSFSKMTEDPRFKSLQKSLVPLDDADT